VTLELRSSSAAEVQVTVNDDTEAIKKQLNEFVAAYNDVTSYIAEKTKYDNATKTGGPLIGDATVASVKRSLQSLITRPVAGSPSIISEIGIATQKNGTLSVDSSKFDAALKSNLAGVGNLFAAATDGLAKSMINFADAATRLGEGILSVRIDGAQGEIRKMADRIANKENSISRLTEDLTRKFTALETLVSQINTQGSYLTQQLAGLSGQLNK